MKNINTLWSIDNRLNTKNIMKAYLKYIRITLILLNIYVMVPNIYAQEAEQKNQQEALAQKLQNPLANLTIIPIMQSWGFNASQNGKTAYATTFQPVFPFNFEKFNIINRAIFGFGYVPGITEGLQLLPQGAPENGMIDGTWGISDLNYSFFYSPKKVNKIAWGIGPSINFPTASDNRMGSGKWSAGPSIVMVFQKGKWTFDMVFRQTWSFAGDSQRRDVNQFVAQPLIAYSLGKGWVASTFPTINVNWDFDKGRKLTLPLGGGITKVTIINRLPVSFALQYYYNVVRPDLAPTSEFRFTTAFIISK
jgi:hypothetical protein